MKQIIRPKKVLTCYYIVKVILDSMFSPFTSPRLVGLGPRKSCKSAMAGEIKPVRLVLLAGGI